MRAGSAFMNKFISKKYCERCHFLRFKKAFLEVNCTKTKQKYWQMISGSQRITAILQAAKVTSVCKT